MRMASRSPVPSVLSSLTLLSVALVAGGCRHLAPAGFDAGFPSGSGWTRVEQVHLRTQNHLHDCGAAALDMVLLRWGRAAPARAQAAMDATTGFTAGELRDQARGLGLDAFVFPGAVDDLLFEIDHARPVIVGVARDHANRRLAHFVVVVGHDSPGDRFLVADPDQGWGVIARADLDRAWSVAGHVTLVIHPRAGVTPIAAAP